MKMIVGRSLLSRPRRVILASWLLLACALPAAEGAMSFIDAQIAAHPTQSGAYILDSAEEALIARAWLVDHAERSIEVQYFIWSTDNIGILAAEALLRAAQRGVKVRVVVDDLLMEAPSETLRALAAHPNIDIRIYNPNLTVGVPLHRRLWNALTDLRAVNQRMHDKTLIIDGKVGITGGRNMSAEYYDYHHEYNFRDRDVLLVGNVVHAMRASFERFWSHELVVPVERLLDETESQGSAQRIYDQLHAYAKSPGNFAPEVRASIAAAETAFVRLTRAAHWGRIEFVCDLPGKNSGNEGLGGGGRSGAQLRRMIEQAQRSIVIQSPYLVPSPTALDLFVRARARGVGIRINTNSLASTDNLQAFAGYRNHRDALLESGIEIFEYRPDAATQRQARERELVGQLPAGRHPQPIFGLHAKTMVVDSKIVFIGTFNLDPRSENLNTEVGVLILDERLARAVERAIEVDMHPSNSWNAARDNPDQFSTFAKRSKVQFWRWMPIAPLL